jgi:hypothetical protein
MECVVFRQEYAQPTQFFLVLAAKDAARGLPATATRGFVVVLEKAWLYLTGYKPTAEVANVVNVSSASTTFIMQVVPAQGGAPERVRVIALEAKNGVDLTPINSLVPPQNVPAGSYMDVVVQGGGFGSFDGPYPWDPNNPPAGSTTLLAEIDPERAARGIP